MGGGARGEVRGGGASCELRLSSDLEVAPLRGAGFRPLGVGGRVRLG